MKLLYFHQHFSTPKGSAGIRSYKMAREMVRRGHQVTMVCGSFTAGQTGLTGPFRGGVRRGDVDGLHVIELDLGYSNRDSFIKRTATFLRYAARSISLALREPADVVFATTTPLTAALPGIAVRWLKHRPFVFEVRDLWPELPRAMGVIRNPLVLGAMGLLEWVSYRSADRLIGLSPGIVEGIARRGIARERIELIPNGCDLDDFANTARPWRPEGVDEGHLLAVFTGTHGIANGLDAVLSAAAVLKARGRSDIRLAFVGDGKLKPQLQARAAAEELTNVLFLDPVDKSQLAGLMAGADLGLQILANVPAFYFGTSPNKFFDYIAAGLPVLINYPGWIAELISKEECGLVVAPDDPAAFADGLEKAAANRAELRRMGARARDLADREFNRDHLAMRWADWVEGAARTEPASSLRKRKLEDHA